MSDVAKKWELLRKDFLMTADDLDKHYTRVNVARVASGSVAAVSSVVSISLFIASFATMGATLGPAIACGVFSGVSGGGNLASLGASLTGFFIKKWKLKKMNARWKDFKKALGGLENVNLWNSDDIDEIVKEVTGKVVKGAKTVYNQVDAITEVITIARQAGLTASTTAKAVSKGARVVGALDVAILPLNVIGLGFSIYDIVDASIELHKKTQCPAGEILSQYVKIVDSQLDNILSTAFKERVTRCDLQRNA